MNCNHVNLSLGGGKLYQFANRTSIQMMSYLLEAPDGRIIMIDGGSLCEPDADFLYDTNLTCPVGLLFFQENVMDFSIL